MTILGLQFFLVGGALQGLVLALLLATRKTNQLANRFLAAMILLISGQSVLVAFDTREFFLAFPHLSKVSWLLPFFIAPSLYLFVAKLTSRQPRLRPADGLHYLPALGVLAWLLPYYAQSRADKLAYLHDFELARQDDFGFIGQLTLAFYLFYLLLALTRLKRYGKKIRDTFSELEHIRLQWLRQFIYIVLALLLIGTVAFYAKKWTIPVLTEIYHYHLHYLGVILMIYWIGYKTLSQPGIFVASRLAAGEKPSTVPPATAPDKAAVLTGEEPQPDEGPGRSRKYERSVLKESDSQAYLDLLLDYMETQKPYRQSNLTIQDLAALVQLPKHHLSQVINERLGKNFYDFINHYRVAEAQQLLLDPRYRHLTNLAVAEEAGFNSKATFNAVFKKQTGQTPSGYVRSHQQPPVRT
ncbi:MAG: helix-turn-helix domain-containing protein [Adhaeribacter sp.]